MSGTRLSVLRLSMTGALSMLILFVACWLGAAIGGLPVTHAYINLFTAGEVSSLPALGVGSLLSFIWGGFAGALVALTYNLLAGFDRRAVP